MTTLKYTLQNFTTLTSDGQFLQELVFVLFILLIFRLYCGFEHSS